MTGPLTRSGERVFFRGGTGKIETVIDLPAGFPGEGSVEPRGIALVAHPHPLFGGSLDNKVAQTLAKVFAELGYASLRPNFRGTGESEGEHDNGQGETADMVGLAEQARARFGELPLVLAGYSFGAFVQSRVALEIAPERMVLVAPPAGRIAAGRSYATERVPAGTIVIHGEKDETVPLANVFDWARSQELPIVVVPGADHFFHRRLRLIRDIIRGQWH